MEYKGKVYISPKYKKTDYLKLKLTNSSKDEDWAQAIRIFEDRIKGRFLNQIDSMLTDVRFNGFAIMALNCLLIETLMQFRYGYEETPRKKNKEKYSFFLLNEFPNVFTSADIAMRFYEDIRCGILHSAQTKNDAILTDQSRYIIELKNGVFSVSVLCLSSELKKYIDSYCIELADRNQKNTRTAFVKKMNYICTRNTN